MIRRRGFTLMEVTVALVITALVASVAWAAVGAGLDTGDRMRRFRDGVEAEATARAMLTSALRHALPGGRGGEPVFQVEPGNGSGQTRLRFLTRGVAEPLGSSGVWEMILEPGPAGLSLEARPLEGDTPAVRTILTRIAGLSVAVAAGAVGSLWRESWNTPDVAPARVALHFIARDAGENLPPLLARVGLESRR